MEPYIGDVDDPNLEEYIKDNPYMRKGYRIGFSTYGDAANSFFMLHNESLNVWSHFLGAIFFLLAAVYVCVYLKPTSLHESDSLLSRWGNKFDQGRYDDLFCDKEDFKFPEPDQCPYLTNEVLDDILETNNLHKWHKDIG